MMFLNRQRINSRALAWERFTTTVSHAAKTVRRHVPLGGWSTSSPCGHQTALLPRSRKNARGVRSQGFNLDFSQQGTASENKNWTYSVQCPWWKGYRPEWMRKIRCNFAFAPLYAWQEDGNWLRIRLSAARPVIMRSLKNTSYVKQTAAWSGENSYPTHDRWNRKSLLNKPLNFNSKVWKSWLGNLCKNTQKYLCTNYTFLPESFLVSLWFQKLRHMTV